MVEECPKCGGVETYTKQEIIVAGHICEYDITCKSCDFEIGYYAYGSFRLNGGKKK